MAAWSQHAVAAPAPARKARPRPKAVAKARPKRRPRQRTSLFGGVVWIVVLAALLAGIVTLNVGVLQLNQQLERANARAAELKSANLTLEGQLSSAGSAPQVASIAHRRLGLVPAPPDRTTYVDLGAAHRQK